MTTYTVHILDTDRKADVVLVPDRFSWAAAIFGFVWALAIGAWDLALALFAVEAAAAAAVPLLGQALNLGEAAQGFAQLGVAAAVGFGAFELRRWLLGLRGYRETDVVTGFGAEDAERRYFDTHPAVTARLLGAA